MPNKKSAYKRLRQDEKKSTLNHSKKAELRTLTKKVRALINSDATEDAEKLLNQLESKLDKAVKTNVIKKGNASRRISRLRKQHAASGAEKS